MFNQVSPHTRAVLQAVFVTFLWSTSWVLIKIALRDQLPAVTFAGLRYTLAFLCLLPLLLRRPADMIALRGLPRQYWLRLIALGLVFYTITQGAQFIGLDLLPAVTVNLLLTLTTILVTGLGIWLLKEHPTRFQWMGVGLYCLGVIIFFYPINIPTNEIGGMIVVLIGVAANTAASLLGRAINRAGILSPLAITTVSMGIGGVLLLSIGLLTWGLPTLRPESWLIILWLAVVNTAFAFTLWNQILRVLSAMESSIINNLMMVQIPILAWVFLGEGFDLKAGIGFVVAGLGILAVQLRRWPARRAIEFRKREA